MNGFISKPFTMDQLTEVIHHVMTASGFVVKESQATVEAPKQKEISEVPLYDLSTLIEMAPDDETFLVIILQKTLKSLAAGRDGLPSLLAEKDLKALSALAHKLKSTAVNIGAVLLADILRKLEHSAREGSDGEHIAELVKQGVEAIEELIPALEVELSSRTRETAG